MSEGDSVTEELVAAAQPELVIAPDLQQRVQEDRTQLMAAQVGTLKLTAAQKAALLVAATDDVVELKPTGELYVPGKFYRDVLNAVFGPGAWAVRHGRPIMDVKDEKWASTLYLNVFLMVGRCTRCARSLAGCKCDGPVEQICLAMSTGAQGYHPTNSRLSYDDALEGAITNGLMRCCAKQLGCYAEPWEPRWAEAARARIGVRVRVADWQGKVKTQWRRVDRMPLDGEQGLAPDSPNADRYKGKDGRNLAADGQHAVVSAVQGRGQDTKVPAHGTVPVDRAATVSTPAKPKGEQIGVIRKAPGGWWVVTTDAGERVTDDEYFVRQLESVKAQGKRVIFELETVPGQKGDRKKIVSWE